MAHIHPAPSPSHPTGPETSSPSQSAASPPSPAQADSEKEVRTPAPAPPPASEPPFATSAPETTPPPSPPRRVAQSHQDHPEPVESSESDIVDVQVMPEEVSFHCDTPPEHAQAAELCETAACDAVVDDDVMESPSENPDDGDVTDAPSTPEKPPVQESAPPVEKVTPAAAIPLDDISEALDNTQVRRTT
ncbi:vegetative cell wall protein gp1-like [Hippocampus comes]|uniref:vegetative cell wall protein gp1-like n=1 Tax=Hippocampus comes TaxID=109280 RepID=UPI00094EE93C|nr:PREDICTED: vegetative cell wall protein gp1-like [Hippocampus comes]